MKAIKKPNGKLVIKVKKGALHKDLGVPQGEKLPAKDLAVKKDDSPVEKKRKVFAQNAKTWNK